MGRFFAVSWLVVSLAAAGPVLATGLATPESGTQDVVAETTPAPLQTSRSLAGFAGQRGAFPRRGPEGLEYPEPPAETSPSSKGNTGAAEKHAWLCCEFRIFDASIRLFDDRDRDGYFTYFSVSFDIDTDYSEADVYAQLFLRGADGVWRFLYETEIFPIFGSASSDEYEIETELVSGYPTGAYDVMIRVYEAAYDDLVIQYGPGDSSAMSVAPLEDLSWDGLPPPSVSISSGSGGGGAMVLELLGLVVLAASAVSRRPRSTTGPASAS